MIYWKIKKMKIKKSSLRRLVEALELHQLEKMSKKQIDVLEKILDTLKGVDISIDQLTALVAGTDALSLQVRQNTYGRLASLSPRKEEPPSRGDVDEGWSDHDKTKSLTENWRRFIEKNEKKRT
jgi:hypothetical protein